MGGPEEVATTAPNCLISQYLRAEGLEVGISDNAEAFVCNTLIYCIALHLRELSADSPIPFTYIHTPTTDQFPHLVLGTGKTIISHRNLVTSAMVALRVMIDPDGCDGEIQSAGSASTPALHIPFGTPGPGVIRRSTRMIGSDPTG
ncbi:MAG: Pyrrolidone-carboxylate peptidase [candidate division WS2 bacterium ADurb.Bin280]|uniref:Pyrrolidone-carboxylate peptidase n=1 Tax=candidate division WS2 bacterium ADurb.Bin280 TaxID=1852829 RepID=A0A1V5SE23_9BACT|nr:MAG: Pyrrolidone-carboxylate peptidase [candidate division WS2 bacterium ADurb.Bin280]